MYHTVKRVLGTVKQVFDRYLLAPLRRYSLPVLFFVVLTILGVLLWRYLAWRELASTLPAKDRIQLENEALRTIAQVLGGTFFLITAYFTYRTVRATEKNVSTSQEGQITERFTRAIEQLGDKEKLEVRLGAIYALERIAQDSERDHQQIMEVLCAYVRENAPRKDTETEQQSPKPRADIQAILTVIGRRTVAHEKKENPIDLYEIDLRGIHLFRADLALARLWNSQLQDAYLVQCDLRDARLQESQLQGANLGRSQLQGAHFEDAHLQKANLGGTQLAGAFFKNTELHGANLSGSNIQEAWIFDIRYDDETQWPEGFTPPADATNTDA
jgi:hypothetical protein